MLEKLSRALLGTAALSFLAGAAPSQAAVIALYHFDSSANLLTDSSPSGTHALTNGTGANDAAFEAAAPTGGGAGSAAFDGNDVLFTTNPLDLTSYRQIRITWWQRVQAATGVRVIFEHSTNYDSADGGLIGTINSDLGTKDASPTGYVSYRMPATRNNDLFNYTVGTAPGTWEKFYAEIDRDAATASELVKIYNGSGTLIGADNQAGNVPAISRAFLNDNFFIGARGTSGAIGFVGNIDELMIESIPEPATAMAGAMVLFLIGRRRTNR